MARYGDARTRGHDQHRPGIVGCVVTRSVSTTAKTGYSVRIHFESRVSKGIVWVGEEER